MNILRRLALWTAAKAAGYGGATFTLADIGDNQKLSSFFGGGTYTGKPVTDSTAMQITTVWACIRLLSETMGAMPSAIYRTEKSGNATKVDEHSLHEVLIEQPNADMNGLEFREARTANLAMRGNQFALIERRGSGDVSSLYPVPAAGMQRKRDASTNFEMQYGVSDRGKVEWYPAEKVWHTKGFSFNGLDGLSPLGYAREAMALALAGEEFNARLFGQGLMPSARVSIPQWLTPEQRVIANKKLLEMHTGLANLNKPMLLEGGMKVDEGFITPDDAQFLQLRQFTVVEICRLFNIKPHMVASLEQATNNNIEQLSLEFIMYTMLPYLRRDEVGARKLFKPADRAKYFYRYNFEGLLRADSNARASLYSILLQNGVFSRNEVRALENRNRVDDPAMDQYTVQSNMAMIDQIAALVAARSAPTTAAGKADELALAMKAFAELKSQAPTITVHPATVKVEQAPVHVNLPQQSLNVDVAGLELAEFKDAVEGLQEATAADNARTRAVMEKAIAEARRPRKAIFNAAGDPVGSVPVDSVEDLFTEENP